MRSGYYVHEPELCARMATWRSAGVAL